MVGIVQATYPKWLYIVVDFLRALPNFPLPNILKYRSARLNFCLILLHNAAECLLLYITSIQQCLRRVLLLVTPAFTRQKTQLGAVSQSRQPRGREGCKLWLSRAWTAAEMELGCSLLEEAKLSCTVAMKKMWEAFLKLCTTPQTAWPAERKALPMAQCPTELLGRGGEGCVLLRAVGS